MSWTYIIVNLKFEKICWTIYSEGAESESDSKILYLIYVSLSIKFADIDVWIM